MKSEGKITARWGYKFIMDDDADFGEREVLECSNCGYMDENRKFLEECPECHSIMENGRPCN